MRKGIYIRFLIIIFITAVISGTISAVFATVREENQVRDNATKMCRALANQYSDHPQAEYWAKVLGVRVTVIGADGIVIDDSHMNAADMENHMNRKEVIHAEHGYVATDTRSSSTLHNPFMYAATGLSDGSIIRVAYEYGGFLRGLAAEIPVFLISFIVTAVTVASIARAFARKVISPLEQFTEQITAGNYETISSDSGYYEIDKITVRIHEFLRKIKRTQEETQLQNENIHYILSNIKEGFILLDHSSNIVLINKSALSIFQVESNLTGGNLMELTRNRQLMEAVADAVEGHVDSLFEVEAADTIFSVHVSPLDGQYVDSKQSGATVLLIDVGAERLSQQQRSEFFTNASHELKTPITTLMGLSEMLGSGTLPEEKKEQIYHRIHIETKRMNNLIGDILTISRLESGMTQDIVERLNIAAIAREVVQAQEPFANEKEVTLSYSGKDVFIMANARRIRDLLSNLTDNAIKYNKPGGSVQIEISSDRWNAIATVKDTGIGIAKSDQNRVFERFYRADSGAARLIKGTGLGLSIVKHIVNSYNGSVKLTSTLGIGTEIVVMIPAVQTSGLLN